MTDDDLAILVYIACHHAQHGRVPRFREIAQARGLSYHGARSAVRRLRAVGQLAGFYERTWLEVAS